MPDVFISYRRGDAAGHAGRLSDSLAAHYGPEHVFIDLDAISPGADFVDRINTALRACDAALVLIGDEWLAAADGTGRRRLDDPADYVRQEIAQALQQDGIQVIPVLVEGTKMPDPESLPEDIRALARRNAIELSDQRWSFDVQRLADAIGRGRQRRRGAIAEGSGGRRPRRPWPIFAGIAAVVAAVAVAAVLVAGGGGGGGGKHDTVTVKAGDYAGSLNNGSPLQFSVTGDEVGGITFNGTAICQSSRGLPEKRVPYAFRGLPTTRGRVQPNGDFNVRVNFSEQTFRMAGRFTADGRAEGSLHFEYLADPNGYGPIGGGPYNCDSGSLAWSAKG